MQQFARRLRGRDELGEHLQRRERAVAGGRMVRQDHMPRLLAADVEAALAHPFEDIAVADLGALEPQPLPLQETFESQVRHHRRDDPAAFRSEEHTSELQSLMRTSYAVFCLKKKQTNN